MEVTHIWMPICSLRGVFPRQNFIYFVSFFLLFFPWLIEPGSLQSEKKILQSLFLLIVSSMVLFFPKFCILASLRISLATCNFKKKKIFCRVKRKKMYPILMALLCRDSLLKFTNYNKWFGFDVSRLFFLKCLPKRSCYYHRRLK